MADMIYKMYADMFTYVPGSFKINSWFLKKTLLVDVSDPITLHFFTFVNWGGQKLPKRSKLSNVNIELFSFSIFTSQILVE